MKKIVKIDKFLTEDDILFIMSSLKTLTEVRNEDNTFNRSIYLATRDDSRFQYLFDKCDEVFYKNYNKRLLSHELYFIRYYKGDYIKRHNDNWQTPTSAGRLYSLVAQMTHPELYSGGDTLVYDKEVIKLSKNQGDGIIFPSSMDHELTEVTDGERFSFVIMYKESLNNTIV